MKFKTKAIHIGSEPNLKEGGSGDVAVPIHLSTTFARKTLNDPTAGFDYSRSGNPTRAALEKNLAQLENGKYAFAYSSGLAAIMNVLLLLQPNDHIIAVNNIYGGTHRLLTQVFSKWDLKVSFINFTNRDDLINHIKPNTKVIFLESPTNPLLGIIDLKSIAELGQNKKIITVIDNTFASPYWQNPLDHGIDIVIHSGTKYLGGHSDVTAGCVITKNDEIGKRLGFLQNAVGAILSPFDSYNLLKGIKTLPVRMVQHEKNTKEVLEFLKTHPKIKKIYYPGLKSHPQFKTAEKQMRGFGGIISFELHGSLNNAVIFLQSLKLITLAVSLGAVESLIEHPASMSHAAIPKDEREKSGISDTLIRLSVGLEDAEDIVGDLSQALAKI